MKIEVVFFSATGTTKKIATAIAQGLDCQTQYTDITLPKNRISYQPSDCDLLVLATPIYGERIPRFVFDYLKQIEGGGRPLVAVSVYGNMGFGISLNQFEDFAVGNHFNLIAAGAFIGEHTYANKKAPVALGRPNEYDLIKAQEFGARIRKKLDFGSITPLSIPKSKLPKFITKVPDSGTRFLIRQPEVRPSFCDSCGACSKRCPTGAIDIESLKINEQKCIRCYACVKTCHKAARVAEFRLHIFEGAFGKMGKKQKDNMMFL